MSIETKNEFGIIKINDQVIANLAGKEVQTVEGIVIPKNFSDGIKVNTVENKVNLEISIVIKYGNNVKEISEKIMKCVKKEVEKEIGMPINNINIFIKGVSVND